MWKCTAHCKIHYTYELFNFFFLLLVLFLCYRPSRDPGSLDPFQKHKKQQEAPLRADSLQCSTTRIGVRTEAPACSAFFRTEWSRSCYSAFGTYPCPNGIPSENLCLLSPASEAVPGRGNCRRPGKQGQATRYVRRAHSQAMDCLVLEILRASLKWIHWCKAVSLIIILKIN